MNLFKDRVFYQKLWKLTIPIALQNLMLSLVAAADAFMLGSVEQNSMAAVSLATQIQFIQNMIVLSVTTGTYILGAQYWGKKDKKALDDIFAITLTLCGATSVLFFAGCFFFPEFLMRIFTNETVLVEIGVKYLRIAGWSYLLTGISQCYLSMMKISEHPAAAAGISSAAVILNIILNAVFIYGLFGVPAMGVQGAAYATLIARIAEALASVFASERDGYLKLRPRAFIGVSRVLIGDFMRCFLPVLGASLLWGIGFTSYTAFMGHMGTDAAAANSIAAVVRDITCCMCNGLASGGGILVGNELGAGDLATGKLYGDRVTALGFICGAVSCGIMFAVTPGVLAFVKLTPMAGHHLLNMMVIMAVYMIGRAVNSVIINGIFAAGGDTMFDVYSLTVTMWCMAVPLAALGTFVLHWPVAVVYACTCLDEVGKIPWVMVHYRKYKWVRDLTR